MIFTCICQIQIKILYVAKPWLVSLNYPNTLRFALNNVAHATFLRRITLGKPTKGLKGQNVGVFCVCVCVWPLLTQNAGVMGSWKKKRPTKTIYLSNSVYFTILIKLHRTWHAGRDPTPTVAWENASLSWELRNNHSFPSSTLSGLPLCCNITLEGGTRAVRG